MFLQSSGASEKKWFTLAVARVLWPIPFIVFAWVAFEGGGGGGGGVAVVRGHSHE